MVEALLDERWRSLAEKALAAPLEILTRKTGDGIAIRPLYSRKPADGPRPWRHSGAWHVAQRIDHPDPVEANRLALLDLEGGADALVLVMASAAAGRGFGLPAGPRALDQALEGIELDFLGVRLDAGPDGLASARALAELIHRRRLTSAALRLDLGFDPLGSAARTGHEPDLGALSELLDLHGRAGLSGRPLLADARPYHEAGAGPAQELAAVLGTAVAYYRQLEVLGLPLDEARSLVGVLLVADADTFVGLAKFRALRHLWARVEQACGLTARPMRLHAETAWRVMSRIDPWVNAMRATAGIFSAGLGGADVITALPFTLANGLPDAAARRLARNAQRVLIDEAHLDAVDDAAAGSGALESLTDELCAQGWMLFQEIERDGGMAASLASGALQARIALLAQSRANALSKLTEGLVGTTRFPTLGRSRVEVLDVAARPLPAPGPRALPAARDSTPFEALRDRVEAMATRPTVFLATLGPPPAFGPRASYAVNVFAIAGIEAIAGTEELDLQALVARYAASGTLHACLCGSDASYAEDGPALVAALHAAGADVSVIGRPREDLQGVSAFIHDGCDALRILDGMLRVSAGRGGSLAPALAP